jgi:hypothetical protein
MCAKYQEFGQLFAKLTFTDLYSLLYKNYVGLFKHGQQFKNLKQ